MSDEKLYCCICGQKAVVGTPHDMPDLGVYYHICRGVVIEIRGEVEKIEAYLKEAGKR